jgi:two-component system, sensor histidine kinase PdtaS
LRKLIILLCCFLSLNLFANQHQTDSLLAILQLDVHDTVKVNTLIQLSRSYKLSDLKLSEEYANQSLGLSENINYCKGKSLSNINLGNVFFYRSLFDQAKINYYKAYQFAKECKDVDAAGSAISGLAIAEMYKGNYEKAIKYNLAALKIKVFAKNKRGIADIYNNIAELYRYLRNIEKALFFNNLSLELEIELKNDQGIADSYHNIAGAYYVDMQYAKAKEWYKKSIEKKIEINDRRGLSSSYINMGAISEKEKNLKKAEFYYRLAYDLKEGLEDKLGMIKLEYSFGRIFINNKNFEEAEKNYLSALKISREIGSKEAIKDAYLNLYELKKSQNKTAEALFYMESFSIIRDSLYSEQILKKTSALESDYLLEKQEKEIVMLQKEKIEHQLEEQINKEKRNYLYIGFSLFFIGGVELFRRYNKKREMNQLLEHTVKERTSNLEAKTKEVELMLKEIHHRVKNNLQLITSLLKLQIHYNPNIKPKVIVDQINTKIKCMAMIHDKLYKAEDFQNLSTMPYFQDLINYIQEMEGRMEISVVCDIEQHYLSLDDMIPCGLIINELLSNVFKHAFDGADSGEVSVNFKCVGNNYILSVKDNGNGIPAGTNFDNTLGLSLVHDLTHQLSGKAEIINSENRGAEIKVVFPGKA